jgi:hypothetical protein
VPGPPAAAAVPARRDQGPVAAPHRYSRYLTNLQKNFKYFATAQVF